MAEVGVLQLTIEDHSESAARGLGRLADVLERVRNAVGSGLGLEGTSNEIEKIAKVVNDAISGSTITKLGQFADALKGLKGINLKSVANAMQGFDQGAAIENTKDQVNALSTEFTKAWTAMNTFYTKYAEIKSLVTGTNTPLLGSGGVAPENALSTQVWTGPNWSPDWTHGENFHPGWISDIDKVREDAIEVESTVSDAMEETAQAASGAADAISDGMTVASGAMEGAARSTGTVTDGMVEVEASVEAATGSAHRFADALDFIKTKAKGAWSSLWQMRDGVNGLKGAFQKMFPTLSTFLSGMGRIAKYRLIRTIIKQITSGMSEGIQNVYHYSKAIGSEFAPAMDSAATALLQMKNSIGAALAPMIQSLIPYLQIVVNWFITAINWVNQFVSLLRGQQTWTRAVPKTTQAFEDQTKAAKKTGAAIKDLLADWDELNIIQSESGGGGGGSGSDLSENYLSMFEQVRRYEGWIKNLVDGIKETFGDVWSLIKRIGIAILGWKLSSVFTGWLGTLAGFVGAGALIGLEFDISTMLNKKYLETGEIGWLIADVLQALVGGVLMKKMLSNVLAGKYAYLGIPIMLAVNATARIFTLLGNADVSALSKEGLISNVVSALEIGGVAGYLAYTSGASMGQALTGGAAAVLITFGALTNLKADVDAVRNGEVTADTIKAKALGSIALSAGSAIAAKLFVPGLSVAQAAGFGLATGAAAFLLTFGAILGITATTRAVKSGITPDVIYDDAKSSLTMGLGSTILIKGITGNSWTISGAAGGGVALIVASALIGIQATTEVVKNGAITKDTIIEDAIASLLAGGGVALIGGTLCGLGAGAALVAGGWAALAVFGALIGIQAILQSVAKEPLKWGDKKLTDEQVQEFVLGGKRFFSVNVPVVLEMVDKTTQEHTTAKQSLAESMTQVWGTFHVIQLGIAKTQDYEAMETDVNNVVDKIHEYTLTARNQEKLTLYLFPSLAENEDVKNGKWLQGNSSGWDLIDQWSTSTGKHIGDLIVKEEAGTITAGEKQVLTALMTQLDKVTMGVKRARINAEAESDFFYGMGSLGDLDQNSFEKVTELYKDYRGKLKEGYKKMAYEMLSMQEELVVRLYAIDPNSDEYKKAVAYRDWLRENVFSVADEEADRAGRPGQTKVLKGIQKVWGNALEGYAASWKDSIIKGGPVFDDTFNELIGIDKFAPDVKKISGGVKDWMLNIIAETDPMLAQALKDNDINPWAVLPDFLKNTIFEELKESYGDDIANKVVKYMESTYGEIEDKTDQFNNDILNGIWQAQSAFGSFAEGLGAFEEAPEIVTDVVVDNQIDEPIVMPEINNADFIESLSVAAADTEEMVRRIRTAIESLSGVGFGMNFSGLAGVISASIPKMATGGMPKSGDLVMANENGKFEMMGRMGNQPVIANNQQIVDGISAGVERANSAVESRLNTIETLLTRMLNKEFVARAVPGSGWAEHNARSDEAYNRVTG